MANSLEGFQVSKGYDPELVSASRPSEYLFELLNQLDVDKDVLTDIKQSFESGEINVDVSRQRSSDGNLYV